MAAGARGYPRGDSQGSELSLETLEEGRLRVVGFAGDESEQVVLDAAQDEGCQMFVEALAEKTVLSVSGLLGTAVENRAAKAL